MKTSMVGYLTDEELSGLLIECLNEQRRRLQAHLAKVREFCGARGLVKCGEVRAD